jgi:PIN domain nuclease of toxin-antitoxin system
VERRRIVLDSGALSALAQEDETVRNAVTKAMTSGATISVPTAVIAESTTGDQRRDAATNRILSIATPIALDERLARRAAALRHAVRARRSGTVDAIVVATADDLAGTVIFTTDRHDIGALAAVRRRSRVDAF